MIFTHCFLENRCGYEYNGVIVYIFIFESQANTGIFPLIALLFTGQNIKIRGKCNLNSNGSVEKCGTKQLYVISFLF